MSSETILFEADWKDGSERFVARVAPDPGDVTVFPSYDLERQFRLLKLVGELTSVPVPKVHWYEPDPSVIGSPFFVMSRVDGVVPPDVMPYNFGDNWLHDAAPEDQDRLIASTVDVIAELHGTPDPTERFEFLEFDEPGDTPLRRHVAHTRAWYDWTAADGLRSPLVERTFEWLDSHWPSEGPAVLSWGDSRIGNVLYKDFEPVGVLDWEMAALGPRELDVAWMIYAHRIFEHLASNFELPGMPDFMRPAEVAAAYDLIEVDEFAGGPVPSAEASAPVGAARIIDIANDRKPKVVSNIRLEVHVPKNRASQANDPGADNSLQGYSGHYCAVPKRSEPGIVACSFILSGLRVFDIRDPFHPKEIAYYNAPRPGASATNYAMSGPAFAPERGEIWYSDGNLGFFAVKVTNGVWPFR